MTVETPLGKTVTMKDVAKLAGVSRAAVSAALSNRTSTIALSSGTRQRIKDIAGQLGYQRNMLARSFIKQKSYLLALLSREEHFVYALETTKGIEEVIEGLDYSLLIFYNGNSVADQARQLQRSLDRKVDGLIVAAAPEAPGGAHTTRMLALRAAGFPIVQIYRRVLDGVPLVMTDDRAIGRLSTQHLIGLGHRHIAHYTHDQYTDEGTFGQNADALQRFHGYEDAMREAGLEPIIVTYPAAMYGGVGYSRGARQFAGRVAQHPAKFTAATTFSDHTAIGLMKGLLDHGVRVPLDFSVVGYDDVDVAAAVEPPLTTLKQPSREIGHEAVRIILDLIAGKPASDVIFEPSLVVRGSTAAPAR